LIPNITYDEFYSNDQAKRENVAIKELIQGIDGYIIDIGSGTGLGFELADRITYLGIEEIEERVQISKKKFNHHSFVQGNAKDILEMLVYVNNVISLFSIEYMDLSVIDLIMSKMKGTMIIIHYNEPYLVGSSSEYAKRGKDLFDFKHKQAKMQLKKKLKQYGAVTTKLLGQEYYYVSVLTSKNQ